VSTRTGRCGGKRRVSMATICCIADVWSSFARYTVSLMSGASYPD
jgi:hypothetical protein